MRTNEERIAAMHERAAELRVEKRKRQAYLAGTASAALCLVLVILLAAQMPRLVPVSVEAPAGPGMSGSMFAANGALGYIVIALVAFVLGVCVTVFCFRLKKWRDSADNKEDL